MDSAGATIPLIVLTGYLLLLLLLGLVSYLRSQRSEEDYYLAGRQQGWIVSSLTIMATFFSSFALLGAPGKVYAEGAIFALFALNVPLSGACVWILGHRIRRLGRRFGYVTPGDMVADYYGGHALRLLTSLTCILYVVPYVVMQIQAGGLLFDRLFREDLFDRASNFTAGAILLAAITTIYIMVGGMRSVAWTDVLQGLMLVGGMLLGGFVVIRVLGGFAAFSRRLTEIPEPLLTAPGPSGTYTPWMLLSICLFASTGTMVSPAQWMRYYAARSSSTLRRSALIFALVLTACFLLGVMLVGLGGLVIYPPETAVVDGVTIFRPHADVGKADQILIAVLHNRLPEIWGVAGLWISSIIVTAIAAASMSTADSNLHALSAVLTRDIYDRYVRPGAGPAERTRVGRWIILAATVVALVLVIGGQGGQDASGTGFLAASLEMIADIGFLAISFSMQLLPAAVDMLWVRRGSRSGAALGLATGLGVTALVYLADFNPAGIRLLHGVWGLLANALVLTLVSRFSRPPARVADYAGALSPRVPPSR